MKVTIDTGEDAQSNDKKVTIDIGENAQSIGMKVTNDIGENAQSNGKNFIFNQQLKVIVNKN